MSPAEKVAKKGAGRRAPKKQGRPLVGASLSDGSALTVLGASRVLQRSEKRVRQFIESGQLVTIDLPKTDETGKRIPVQVTAASVVALKQKMSKQAKSEPKSSRPSNRIEAQLKALTEQVELLTRTLRAIEASNSEARQMRERAQELEQRLAAVERAELEKESPPKRRWWQR
jgi:hypothetical protein